MARPANLSKTVLSGFLAGGEIFQTGFWNPGALITEEIAQAAADSFAASWNGGTNVPFLDLLSPDSGYDKVTVYSYPNPTGPAELSAEAALTGNGRNTSQHPDQCCVVVTLLTGKAGRRNRGRMFLPANGMPLTSHQLTLVQAQNVADGWTALIEDTQTFAPVVVSQVAGTANDVTSVRVDTRIDIQRRRANSQIVIGRAESALAF